MVRATDPESDVSEVLEDKWGIFNNIKFVFNLMPFEFVPQMIQYVIPNDKFSV